MERTFKREVNENLKNLHKEVSDFTTKESLEGRIQRMIEICVFETFRLSASKDEILAAGKCQNIKLENLKRTLEDVIYKNKLNNGIGYQLLISYERLHQISLKLTSENLQKSNLDLSERWRYLFFRGLTAITIAATVLVTGYLSSLLQIPLPMIK
ncbi:MAG: hypothetical protein ACPHVV_04510 [Porticoccaceae bacterium]